MLLNTSFNTLLDEPIVESPHHALRSFLSTFQRREARQDRRFNRLGSMLNDKTSIKEVFKFPMSRLVLHNKILKRRQIPEYLSKHQYSLPRSIKSPSPSLHERISVITKQRRCYSSKKGCWFNPSSCDEQNTQADVTGDIDEQLTLMQRKKCFPVMRHPTSASRVSAFGDGSVSQVEVQIPAFSRYEAIPYKWHCLTDDLELSILENCNGGNSLQDIIEQFVTSDDGIDGDEGNEAVCVKDVLLRVINLWENTLIKL